MNADKTSEIVIDLDNTRGKHSVISKYWNNEGKYKQVYDKMYADNVPDSGECENKDFEVLRCLSRIMYDKYNNGNCNAIDYDDGQHEDWEYEGDTEASVDVTDFYLNLNNKVSDRFPELKLREYIGLFDGDELDSYMNELIEQLMRAYRDKLALDN